MCVDLITSTIAGVVVLAVLISESKKVDTALTDQYVHLQRGHNLYCMLPTEQTTTTKQGQKPAPTKRCRWWQDGRLLQESTAYKVTMSDGGRCALRIAGIEQWDAAPTLYRCSDGELPEDMTDNVIRLWLKVIPSDPELTLEGPTVTSTAQLRLLNLSSFTSDTPVTVVCRAAGGRPVAKLFWELDGREVKSEPPAQVTTTGNSNLYTASIRLPFRQQQSEVPVTLKCLSQHLAYGRNPRSVELKIVGQYRSPEVATNIVLLAGVGVAIALLIIIIAIIVIVVQRKKVRSRNRMAFAMSPVTTRPLPQPRRPLPSIRLPTESRDSYLVPTAVVGGLRRDAVKREVVALPSIEKGDEEHLYHEIGAGPSVGTPDNSYIIVF